MIEHLSDDDLLRYSRQIMLPAFDVAGQLALANAQVLIMGLGGLGSPVALYLAAAGVGKLVLVDHDTVDLSNLQRQVVHEHASIGLSKVSSAAQRLKQLNPGIKLDMVAEKLSDQGLADYVARADVVLDCTDNFATRFAINAACVKHSTPLVSGAAIRMEGQLAVFDLRSAQGPCYQCLYSDLGEQELTCSESGVLSPLVGVIGSMQALEAIKLIAKLGTSLSGALLLFDALHADWRRMNLRKDPACKVCGATSSAS